MEIFKNSPDKRTTKLVVGINARTEVKGSESNKVRIKYIRDKKELQEGGADKRVTLGSIQYGLDTGLKSGSNITIVTETANEER